MMRLPDGDGDLIEIGGRPALWPGRGARAVAVGLALAALGAGFLLGFAAGQHASPGKTRPRAVTRVPLPGEPQIFYTGNQCAVQRGRTLQLGIEIDNRSGQPIDVSRIRSVLPRGGLRQLSGEVATCGSLVVPGGLPLTTIVDGASAWLTMTFAVKVRCPASYPVLFVINYTIAGKVASEYFDGFPDLSLVSYSGCGNPKAAERSRR
jgi:hypothetical protein